MMTPFSSHIEHSLADPARKIRCGSKCRSRFPTAQKGTLPRVTPSRSPTAICVARGLPGRQIEAGMIYLPASRKLPFGSYCRICSEPRV